MEQLNTWFLNILLLGGILFVGLFNILIYFVRKLNKVYYYFGLICVFYFIWYICSVIDFDLFLLSELNDQTKRIVAALSSNRMVLFFILYMMGILNIHKPKYEKWTKITANILFIAGLFMPLSVGYSNVLIWVMELFNLGVQMYLGYEVIKRIKDLRKDVRLINALAYLMVCGTAMMQIFQVSFHAETISLAFLMIVSQAIILAIHYNTALIEAEQAAATLEKKVVERTVDLVQKEEETIHLISSISHDLRTPISVVSGYMELMQSDPHFPPQHKPYVAKSLVRLLQMEKLTIDLFTLSQISDKNYMFQMERVNMVEMVQQVIELYEEQAIHKGIRLNLQAESEAWCQADKMRLLQVLDNLMMNALAYARSTIGIMIQVGQGQVKVIVSDDGRGLQPDELPYVFDRYYKRRKRGSGIGLNNVKVLVLRMHGEVSVESVPEAGTRFMFSLPLESIS